MPKRQELYLFSRVLFPIVYFVSVMWLSLLYVCIVTLGVFSTTDQENQQASESLSFSLIVHELESSWIHTTMLVYFFFPLSSVELYSTPLISDNTHAEHFQMSNRIMCHEQEMHALGTFFNSWSSIALGIAF